MLCHVRTPPIAAESIQSSPTPSLARIHITADAYYHTRTARTALSRAFPINRRNLSARAHLTATAMPTPESELFLAKKPKVAPTFDGVDYEDNKALKAAQDAIIREQWVRSMMARLVRDEMGKCYRREGVNHLEKCGHLRGRFLFGISQRVCYGVPACVIKMREVEGRER
jgi:hypothetical protein